MMKKTLAVWLLIGLLVLPLLASAQKKPPTVLTSVQDLLDLVETIGNWVFTFLLVIVVIMLIISGFVFITAAGNPEKVNTARSILIYALIGLAVALAAKGMVEVIKNLLGA